MKRISECVGIEKGTSYYKLVLDPPEVSLTEGKHEDGSRFFGMKKVKVWLTGAEIRAIAKWVEENPFVR